MICPICVPLRIFHTKAHYNRHWKSHSQTEPLFSCLHCSRQFSDRSSAKRHSKEQNGHQVYDKINKVNLPIIPSSASNVPIICTDCSRTFTRKESLKKHHCTTNKRSLTINIENENDNEKEKENTMMITKRRKVELQVIITQQNNTYLHKYRNT